MAPGIALEASLPAFTNPADFTGILLGGDLSNAQLSTLGAVFETGGLDELSLVLSVLQNPAGIQDSSAREALRTTVYELVRRDSARLRQLLAQTNHVTPSTSIRFDPHPEKTLAAILGAGHRVRPEARVTASAAGGSATRPKKPRAATMGAIGAGGAGAGKDIARTREQTEALEQAKTLVTRLQSDNPEEWILVARSLRDIIPRLAEGDKVNVIRQIAVVLDKLRKIKSGPETLSEAKGILADVVSLLSHEDRKKLALAVAEITSENILYGNSLHQSPLLDVLPYLPEEDRLEHALRFAKMSGGRIQWVRSGALRTLVGIIPHLTLKDRFAPVMVVEEKMEYFFYEESWLRTVAGALETVYSSLPREDKLSLSSKIEQFLTRQHEALKGAQQDEHTRFRKSFLKRAVDILRNLLPPGAPIIDLVRSE